MAPPRPMAGGPGPGPGDPAAVAAAAAGRTLTWPRAGERDPAEQGEAPPRTGYSPPRAEHSGRPGDATQGWGAPVVIVPRVRSLLLVLHFAFSLRSRLRRRAPALDPPERRRSTPACAALGGRCRDRSGPVGFLTGQMDQAAGGVRPGELPADVAEVLEPAQGPSDGARVAMDPGGERPRRRASSWHRPGRSRTGPRAPAGRSG